MVLSVCLKAFSRSRGLSLVNLNMFGAACSTPIGKGQKLCRLEIRISSLHNFCPLPMGVEHAAPNIFKFTSDNPRERENAFKHTLKTMETAVRVKAPLVVLHMGDRKSVV